MVTFCKPVSPVINGDFILFHCWLYCFYLSVDSYAWLVNGTAQVQVEKFMEEEHSFDEYTKVT